MMRTPDGHGRRELSRFLTPPAVADHRKAPVNALGYLRVMDQRRRKLEVFDFARFLAIALIL